LHISNPFILEFYRIKKSTYSLYFNKRLIIFGVMANLGLNILSFALHNSDFVFCQTIEFKNHLINLFFVFFCLRRPCPVPCIPLNHKSRFDPKALSQAGGNARAVSVQFFAFFKISQQRFVKNLDIRFKRHKIILTHLPCVEGDLSPSFRAAIAFLSYPFQIFCH